MSEERGFIVCPLEADGCDKARSFEADIATDVYHCHNCGEYGNISELDEDIQESIFIRLNENEEE